MFTPESEPAYIFLSSGHAIVLGLMALFIPGMFFALLAHRGGDLWVATGIAAVVGFAVVLAVWLLAHSPYRRVLFVDAES